MPTLTSNSTNAKLLNQSLSPGSALGSNHSSSSIMSSSTSTTVTQQQNQEQQQQQRLFDPSQQKTFLLNSIADKENKLKQQVERFSLLDELIKETEKKSKNAHLSNNNSILSTLFTNNTNNNTNNALNVNTPISNLNTNQIQQQQQQQLLKQQMNIVDLNDIYCHFPEMCTHHLKEVEDFTFMCCQLFQLEESIKSQKQLLSNLEFDLQKELNVQQPNQQQSNHNGSESSTTSQSHTLNNSNANVALSTQLQQLNLLNSNNNNNNNNTNEMTSTTTSSPEIDEFRKEVNLR